MSALEREVARFAPQRAFPRTQHIPAPRTLTLQPEQFVEAWEARPHSPVEIGICVPSEYDAQGARIEANRIAAEKPVEESERDEVFNDALMAMCVARSICSVENVREPHPLFSDADDTLTVALKPRTIRRIFDEVERLHIDQSPLYSEIDEGGLLDLDELLGQDDPFEDIEPVKAKQARRYLQFALEILRK